MDGVGDKLGLDEVALENVVVDEPPGELISRPTCSSFHKKNLHP
nr:hypothetical protein [Tanacetum cinerariifolium]